MQLLLYLKPDSRKDHLIIRSLAGNSPLARQLCRKAPCAARDPAGSRLERGEQGEGRGEERDGGSGESRDPTAYYLPPQQAGTGTGQSTPGWWWWGSSAGAQRARGSTEGRRGCFSPRDAERSESGWGDTQGQAGAAPHPPIPPPAPPSRSQTVPAITQKKGSAVPRRQSCSSSVMSFQLNHALAQHLLPAVQHIPRRTPRQNRAWLLCGEEHRTQGQHPGATCAPSPKQDRDSRGTRQVPQARQ